MSKSINDMKHDKIKDVYDKLADNRVKCPFCGSKTVTATVVLCYYGRIKNIPIYKDGVDVNMGDLQEIDEPSLRCSSFHCSSCDQKWYPSQYKLVREDNDECSFEYVEKSRK